MRAFRSFTIALLLAGFMPAIAAAADCPVQATDDKSIAEAVSDALTAAPNCREAVKLGQLCGFGSTLDQDSASTIIDKCEKEGLAKLNKQKVAQYKKASDACDRKYEHQEGSLYRGFAAQCREKVAGQFLAQ